MSDGLISYLDQRELELLETLTEKYDKFIEPGPIQKQIIKTKEKVSDVLPEKFKEVTSDAINKASDWAIIKKVKQSAGKGFGVVNENSARYTFNKDNILKSLRDDTNQLYQFEQICQLKSYYIERNVLNRRRLLDLPSAFLGGGITGFFGLWGVPFNLAYTFLSIIDLSKLLHYIMVMMLSMILES